MFVLLFKYMNVFPLPWTPRGGLPRKGSSRLLAERGDFKMIPASSSSDAALNYDALKKLDDAIQHDFGHSTQGREGGEKPRATSAAPKRPGGSGLSPPRGRHLK